jgi:putative amide transporter protein
MAMLLAVVLLYVGAVLGVNGIWLIGQARTAAAEPVSAGAGAAAGPIPAGAAAVGGAEPGAVKRSPIFLEGREVAVINIFTGFVGVVIALIYLIQAAVQSNLASARGAGSSCCSPSPTCG